MPEPNSSSICSLSSGCVGATTFSTCLPSNSPSRSYRGSYIGPPTSKIFKLPAISAPVVGLPPGRSNLPTVPVRVKFVPKETNLQDRLTVLITAATLPEIDFRQG